MVDRGGAEDEPGDIGSHLLPRVVLHNFAFADFTFCLGVMWSKCFGKEKLCVCYAGGSNLERFSHEFILGIDLKQLGDGRRTQISGLLTSPK